jgi:hypothetical protein
VAAGVVVAALGFFGESTPPLVVSVDLAVAWLLVASVISPRIRGRLQAELPEEWRVRPVPRWPSSRRRAGGRPEAARRAGLEMVERVLTASIDAANRTTLHVVKRSGFVAP